MGLFSWHPNRSFPTSADLKSEPLLSIGTTIRNQDKKHWLGFLICTLSFLLYIYISLNHRVYKKKSTIIKGNIFLTPKQKLSHISRFKVRTTLIHWNNHKKPGYKTLTGLPHLHPQFSPTFSNAIFIFSWDELFSIITKVATSHLHAIF